MKTRIILFAVAILALLSFTFVTGNQAETNADAAEQQVASTTEAQGGIILEDKTEW